MNVINLAMQAANMKGWPYRQENNGDMAIEVPTQPGRSQVVTLTMAQDGDGQPAAFIWSKACELNQAGDPWALLRHNLTLTYGKVAVRENMLVILHALADEGATIVPVGKAIYWVARAADELEQRVYGNNFDRL